MKTYLLIAALVAVAFLLGRQHGMQTQARRDDVAWQSLEDALAAKRRPGSVRAGRAAALPPAAPKAPAKILFHGQQAVKRAADGHYYLDGAVNGVPVKFLVDTGASLSVISADLAGRAGIGPCASAEFRTAMGIDRDGCVAKAARLDFGAFSDQDVYLGVSKNLDGDALLGMNVLKDLSIEQSGDTLILENNP